MVKSTIIEGVQSYLQDLHRQGLEVSFGVVFGSQVTGSADALSDIDLLVVSPLFDIEIDREEINRLWRVAARSDSRIEPIACGQAQWEQNSSVNPIINIARREGQVIPVNH